MVLIGLQSSRRSRSGSRLEAGVRGEKFLALGSSGEEAEARRSDGKHLGPWPLKRLWWTDGRTADRLVWDFRSRVRYLLVRPARSLNFSGAWNDRSQLLPRIGLLIQCSIIRVPIGSSFTLRAFNMVRQRPTYLQRHLPQDIDILLDNIRPANIPADEGPRPRPQRLFRIRSPAIAPRSECGHSATLSASCHRDVCSQPAVSVGKAAATRLRTIQRTRRQPCERFATLNDSRPCGASRRAVGVLIL